MAHLLPESLLHPAALIASVTRGMGGLPEGRPRMNVISEAFQVVFRLGS